MHIFNEVFSIPLVSQLGAFFPLNSLLRSLLFFLFEIHFHFYFIFSSFNCAVEFCDVAECEKLFITFVQSSSNASSD